MKILSQYLVNPLTTLGLSDNLDRRERVRVFTLNAIIYMSILFILAFVFIAVVLGFLKTLQALLLIPVLAAVLWFNFRKNYTHAKVLFIFSLLVIIFFAALENRRLGFEYFLMTVACLSVLVFESAFLILCSFLLAMVFYMSYVRFDYTHPFSINPSTPYSLVQQVLMFTAVLAVIVQSLLFRFILASYSEQLQETNNALNSSNNKLHILSNQLDWIVKQKSNELQSYLNAIDIHICSAVVDRHGVIVKINNPLLQMLGFKEDELYSKNLTTLNTNGDRNKNIGLPAEGQQINRTEMTLVTKEGNHLCFDTVFLSLSPTSESAAYFLMLALPITERKLLEEEHERTKCILESVAFKTSHSIRGPLARLAGLINLIEHDIITKDEVSRVANHLIDSVRELDACTTDLALYVDNLNAVKVPSQKDRPRII